MKQRKGVVTLNKEQAIRIMRKHVGTYAQVYAKFLYRIESGEKVYSFFAATYNNIQEVVEVEDLNPYIAAILGLPIVEAENGGAGIVVQPSNIESVDFVNAEIVRLLSEAVYGRDTLDYNTF